jgi:HD-GYP domain-containing protein (c-di-GMP phosphodiesterase class II)
MLPANCARNRSNQQRRESVSVENRPANLVYLVPSGADTQFPADRWGALDRFARDLPRCQDQGAATRLFLAAVHEALNADTVCAVCARRDSTAAVDVIGRPIAPAWCRTLLRLALAEAPGAESVLRSEWSLPPDALAVARRVDGAAPVPTSLAMVQLSKSRSIWAAALSFTAQRFEPADMTLLSLARQLLINTWQSQQTQGQLRHTVVGLVHAFTEEIDGCDPYMAGHGERVARIAFRLGEQMGLSAADLGDLYLAGLLHDVGKIGIRDATWQKPGPLTAEEMACIREHSALGAGMVSRVAPIAHLAPIVRGHHEHYDGHGYPDGLAGERIPVLARVLALADSFEAMLADRPYRPALCPRQIEVVLADGANGQWDGQIVRQLLACWEAVCLLGRTGQGARDSNRRSGFPT